MVTPAPTLSEIVRRFGGKLIGEDITINKLAPLSSASASELSFYANPKYQQHLKTTKAGAVILGAKDEALTSRPRIVSDDPQAYYIRLLDFFYPPKAFFAGVHASAVVASDANVPSSCHIGPLAVIGSKTNLGENCIVEAGCIVGEGVEIGDGTHLHARVVVEAGCSVGKRCIIHGGAVIGADGFGLAQQGGCWIKIPQVGRVVIGDDVEIGANTTIDRGALEDTIIEEGVKLDNQIQIAHNVRIGAHTAIAGCVGIAGSAKIGSHCTIGGGAGLVGHIEICDDVHISGFTLITKSIAKPGIYSSGVPFTTHEVWLKNMVQLRRLGELAEKLNALQTRFENLAKRERGPA